MSTPLRPRSKGRSARESFWEDAPRSALVAESVQGSTFGIYGSFFANYYLPFTIYYSSMRDLHATFGLTGGIASGKSTVGRFFADLGARVIEADALGHELIRPPLPAYQEIVARFGTEILDASQQIDRRRLGSMVFSDSEKLQALNAILHPRIIERSFELAGEYRRADPHALVLVDAALIYEAGIQDCFTKILVAWCRPEQQIERLMGKAALSQDEAERRVAAQKPADEKRRLADFVIDCSGTKQNTRRQVEALYPVLRRLVEGK